MIFLWKILIVSLFLFQWTNAFTSSVSPSSSGSIQTVRGNYDSSQSTQLLGVLSRSVIMSNSKAKNCRKMKASNGVKTPLPPISKRFLMDAMDEAKLRQELILDALDKERGKYENISKAQDQGAEENSQIPSHTEENQKNENADNNRSPQQKLNSIDGRRLEILQKMDQLKILKQKLSQQNDNALAMETLQSFKNDFVTLGFVSILEHNPDTWKIRLQRKDYGRPDGFDGLVFYTARGVPILVGRPKAHKDETLRRIAQGADLWFQVEDYQGSRVLLRSSLQRGLKDSKECKQMAANLAARFSDSCYYSFDDNHKKAQHTDRKTKQRIPIMYCDSRKVAKRGSGVGKMNHRKKLGRMYGDPNAVEDLTRKVMKRHDFEVYWCRKS